MNEFNMDDVCYALSHLLDVDITEFIIAYRVRDKETNCIGSEKYLPASLLFKVAQFSCNRLASRNLPYYE